MFLPACFFGTGLPSGSSAPPPLSTSFQSPTRTAPAFGVVFSRITSCGDGLPSVSVGHTSFPSSGNFWSSVAPASVSSVGYQSTMCIGSVTVLPGLILPSQVAHAATRTPPS